MIHSQLIAWLSTSPPSYQLRGNLHGAGTGRDDCQSPAEEKQSQGARSDGNKSGQVEELILETPVAVHETSVKEQLTNFTMVRLGNTPSSPPNNNDETTNQKQTTTTKQAKPNNNKQTKNKQQQQTNKQKNA